MTAVLDPHASPRRPTRLARGRQIVLAVLVVAVSIAALLWVAPLSEVADQIGRMNPFWVLAAIGVELGSCLSYVVIFRRVFPEPSRRDGLQVAWMAMGAGAVLPGGNISSAAATSLLLRCHGIGVRELVTRCAGLLCLLTGFGFAVNGAAGVALLIGAPGGPHDLAHAGVPILVSIAFLGGAAAAVLGARRLGSRAPRVLRAVATGFEGAWSAARTLHWRLLGGAGFLLLDMAALYCACAATGHRLGVLALIIGYCIGYLATTIPIPAGIGVLDTGLAAALVLYGMNPAASVSAVLVYHAISIWVPGLGGLIAWLPTRHLRRRRGARISRPLALGLPEAIEVEG
ncbi:MAG: lysylphosphatidylglycerol synthase transmembrane domain-containing protein [Solirubrobacteraceae bacterium]